MERGLTHPTIAPRPVQLGICALFGAAPPLFLLDTRSRGVHVTIYYWRVCLSGAR